MCQKNPRWYVIHTYSGSENRVAQLIKEQAVKQGLEDCFEEIVIPTEEVLEIKNGEKINSSKKYLPGYILIKMVMNDETWHLTKNIPRVSGFLGIKGQPSPVSEAEVKRILKQAMESVDNPREDMVLEIGDQVKVNDGPFASFSGFVEEIEEDKKRIKVSVMVFGRPTPITLEYVQVEKI
jgi:transcriptional antiterminator NusG